MRIGVDATCWASRRGYGRFLRALLTATLAIDRANQYVLFVDGDYQEFPLPGAANIVRVKSDVPATKAAAANGRRSVRDMWTLSRAMSRANVDLVFFPSVYTFVPVASSVPKIVTIHDAIPELHPELVFPTLKSKLFWRTKVKLACLQARIILTVSEYSRSCLAHQLGIKSSRLRVVGEAADPVFCRMDGSLETLDWLQLPARARYLMYVGGFSPHKNLAMLVDTFRELQLDVQYADVYLLLVGDFEKDVFHSCYPELAKQVQESALQRKVLFVGYLGDREVATLLNCAEALVLPSFSEGFGLPAIEAASCGAPTIVTSNSPLPQLLGDGTIGVDPLDRAGLLSALKRVLDDPRKREAMRTAALDRAAQLSWDAAARQLLAVFQEVHEKNGATA